MALDLALVSILNRNADYVCIISNCVKNVKQNSEDGTPNINQRIYIMRAH